jgi:IstB-like ATP binding protein
VTSACSLGRATPGCATKLPIEDVDYRAAGGLGLDRALFQNLEGAWIDAHENLILCGRPASAKGSPVPSATKPAATTAPSSANAFPSSSPISAFARGDGRYVRLLRALAGLQLLILDVGVSHPSMPPHATIFSRSSKNAKVVDRRSSPAKPTWTNGMTCPSCADAILDRIVRDAHRINFNGHRLRRSHTTEPLKE